MRLATNRKPGAAKMCPITIDTTETDYDGPNLNKSPRSDGIPRVIEGDLNPDIERDMLARMSDPARKRSMLRPNITEKEMAEYVALAEEFEDFTHWISGSGSSHTNMPWIAAISVIVGFLTAMLIVAIAITV